MEKRFTGISHTQALRMIYADPDTTPHLRAFVEGLQELEPVRALSAAELARELCLLRILELAKPEMDARTSPPPPAPIFNLSDRRKS